MTPQADCCAELVPSTQVDCFLCEPEGWRVIHSGRKIQIVAGLGPLVEGYVLLAPMEHIPTTVEMPADVFAEFSAAEDLLRTALKNQYGPGYTAYEHGRLGSCRVAEHAGAVNTFCFHAHRVYIPGRVTLPSIDTVFEKSQLVRSAEEFRRWSHGPYVYYEVGPPTEGRLLGGATTVPSQFMRRSITAARGRTDWDWSADLKLPDVIQAVRALRGEFVGLDYVEMNFGRRAHLTRSVFIDGYAGAGKSSLAIAVGQLTGAPVFNTGLVFRLLAHAEAAGYGVSIEALANGVMVGDRVDLRSPAISRRASEMASLPEHRGTHDKVAEQLLARFSPAIITGRDSWRHADASSHCLRIDASFETRAFRLFLEQSRHGKVSSLEQIRSGLLERDSSDASRLPERNRAQFISNDRRPFKIVLREVLDAIGIS